MKYSSLLLILSAFFSNILNFVVNPGDSLAKIPRGISIITVLFTYLLIFSHQRRSNASERKSYFRQGPLIPLFANKLGATMDVMTLNLNMLKFRRTPGIYSYSLGKHYLDLNEFNFSKYLNAMVRELKYYSHQAKKSRVLQYLNHSYAEVPFINIFQNLAYNFPFLCKFYFILKLKFLHCTFYILC